MSGKHTEKRIMNTALEIILTKGYDAARTKEIADMSGVSEATIFKYFKSKEDILRKIAYEMINQFTEESKTIIGKNLKEFQMKGNGSYKELLRIILTERINYFIRENNIIRLLVREMLINPLLKKLFIETIYNNLIGVLDIIIKKGVEADEFDKNTATKTLKDTIFGIIIYNSVIQFALDDKQDKTANAEVMTDLIMKAVV